MGAGLAGRPPCLPYSQVLMGAGLAERPPCLPHSQVLMGAGLWGTSLSTTQSGPYGCWVSWGDLPVYHHSRVLNGCWVSRETSLSTTQSGPLGAGLAERPPCLPQSGPYGCWDSWETSLSTTQSGPYGCWVSWGDLPVYHTVGSLWVLG